MNIIHEIKEPVLQEVTEKDISNGYSSDESTELVSENTNEIKERGAQTPVKVDININIVEANVKAVDGSMEAAKESEASAESGERVNVNKVDESDSERDANQIKNGHEKQETDRGVEPRPQNKQRQNDDELRQIATQLFRFEFISIEPIEYTQYLSGVDEESARIRFHFMRLFLWDSDLLKATRMLCSKIYMKGESQELDRLLLEFARAYLEQHSDNVFCTNNHEKIYIIMYSLILLNTALHNVEISRKNRISQTDYIRNTLNAFMTQNPQKRKALSVRQRIMIEKELGKYYESLVNEELELRHAMAKEEEASYLASSQENSPMRPRRNEGDHRLSKQVSRDSSIWSVDSTSKRNSLQVKRMPSGASTIGGYKNPTHNRVGFTRVLMYENQPSFKSNQLNKPINFNKVNLTSGRVGPHSDNSNGRFLLDKKQSRLSMISRSSVQDENMSVMSLDTAELQKLAILEPEEASGAEHIDMDQFNADDYQDKYDLAMELQGSPFLKEGLLKMKILNNDDLEEGTFVIDQTTSSAASTHSMASSTASRLFSLFRAKAQPVKPLTQNRFSNKFQEVFVVVSKGVISMYSFDAKIVKKHKQKQEKERKNDQFFLLEDNSAEDSNAIGDGNWLKNAVRIGAYNLCSTFADIGNSAKGTQAVWCLSFPRTSKKEPRKIVFEAGTKEIALEFINTCNLWASKISAVPTLEESVSSIEYGWSNLERLISNKNDFRKLKIQKWELLPKGVYLSNYVVENASDLDTTHAGVIRQFIKTVHYYSNLKKKYNEFLKLRLKFIQGMNSSKSALSSSNYSRVMHNFDAKTNDYKAELKKYKSYLILLGFAIKIRLELESLDKNQAHGIDAGENVDSELASDEDLLKEVARCEIDKIFQGIAHIDKVIPNIQSYQSLNSVFNSKDHDVDDEAFPLVRSPKNFTLSNYNEEESPIKQLLETAEKSDRTPAMHLSYSTGTIKEEEEEDQEPQNKQKGKDGIKYLDADNGDKLDSSNVKSKEVTESPTPSDTSNQNGTVTVKA